MPDPVITAERRARALQAAAKALGVEQDVPSTKADVGAREAFLAELLLRAVDRIVALEDQVDDLQVVLQANKDE